jgi:hypothetical protein
MHHSKIKISQETENKETRLCNVLVICAVHDHSEEFGQVWWWIVFLQPKIYQVFLKWIQLGLWIRNWQTYVRMAGLCAVAQNVVGQVGQSFWELIVRPKPTRGKLYVQSWVLALVVTVHFTLKAHIFQSKTGPSCTFQPFLILHTLFGPAFSGTKTLGDSENARRAGACADCLRFCRDRCRDMWKPGVAYGMPLERSPVQNILNGFGFQKNISWQSACVFYSSWTRSDMSSIPALKRSPALHAPPPHGDGTLRFCHQGTEFKLCLEVHDGLHPVMAKSNCPRLLSTG